MYILFYSMINLKSKFLASLGAFVNDGTSLDGDLPLKKWIIWPPQCYIILAIFIIRGQIFQFSISEPSRTLWCISFFIHAAELELSARLKIQLSSADPMCKSCKKRMKNGTFHLQTIYQCKQTPKYSKWFSTN